MKAIFAHSFPMIFDEYNNVYSQGGFSYDVWKRYLRHFDELTIIARKKGTIKSDKDKDKQKLTVSSGPGVQFFEVPNLSSVKGQLINKNKASQIIKSQLRKADVLIARLPSEVGALAIKMAIKERKPYLVEVVGCPYDALRLYGNLKGKFYAPISRFKTKSLIRNSNYTVYVTKDYLQSKYPTNGSNINISNVNIADFDVEVLNNRIKSINRIDDRKKIKIGMIGSLNSKYKGFDLAIEYLSRLKSTLPEFEIHILGPGDPSNFDELLDKYDMRSLVYFDGILPSGSEVFQWLDEIDIYIHPSLTEGLPRALVEAMSRGCPAIGSIVGGIPELITEKFLFDPKDYKEFSDCIIKLVTSRQMMNLQAKSNFYTAKEYTSDTLLKRRDEFIQKFIYENC